MSVNILRVNTESIVGGLLPEMVKEILLRGKFRAGVPLNRQLTSRQYCPVLRLGDDANEILTDDYLDETSNILYRLFIYVGKRRSHRRRPHDSPVQHSWDSDMVNELELTSHQGSSIQRRNWFTQHRPICNGSPLRCHAQRQIELLVSNQILVSDATPLRARDDAIRHREILNRLSKFLGSETQQGFPSGGCSKCEIF